MDRNLSSVKLVLASSSPRRVALFKQVGLCFTQIKPEINEAIGAGESPHQYVLRVSAEKARSVAETLVRDGDKTVARDKLAGDPIVLAADTIVVLDGNILGKPESKLHADKMLTALSDRWHQVLTGITICNSTLVKNFVVATSVEFKAITTEEIERYWETGEPRDKAGGYGIQGLGAVFVKAVEGSYSNVMGLPLKETIDALKSFGIDRVVAPPETEFKLVQDSQHG